MHKVLLALLPLLLATSAAAQVKVIRIPPRQPDPLAGPELADPLSDVQGATGAAKGPHDLPVSIGREGDAAYQPKIGQAGKDVIWVPTPDTLVSAMLQTARVGPSDYVVDLGSGDGRIAIAAARDFGAQAAGIEYNADMVALARRNARRAGVSGRVTFKQGDIFKSDFSRATVVTMYLLPGLNLRLRGTLLHMRPGTRIVSHAFSLGDWEPDQIISRDEATGYFWIVPAQVEGRWAFEIGGRRFTANIRQTYQKLGFASKEPFQHGRLRGSAISITRSDGQVLHGVVRGDEMVGRGWLAEKIRKDKQGTSDQ